MKKLVVVFLCLFVFMGSYQAFAKTRQIARYIVPEGATEVALVQISEDEDPIHEKFKDKIPPKEAVLIGSKENSGIPDMYHGRELPPQTTIVFYDKDGKTLEAEHKPLEIKEQIINIDNLPVKKDSK